LAKVSLRRSVSVSDGLLALLALSSSFAFFRAQESWLVGLLLVAGLGLTLSDVGERAHRTTERAAWALVAVVGVVGIGWTLYFLLDGDQIVQFRGVLGASLVLLMAVFLMGRDVWRPERGLVPVSFATLVLAAIGPGTRVTPVLTIAALTVVAWLLIDRPSGPGEKGAPRVRWVPASAFVLMTAALASGIIGALPVAQPLVEQAARRFSSGQGSSGLAESGALGAVEQLGLSRKIVLRMWADAPGLLRAQVHSTFDGRAWTSPPGGLRQLQRVGVDRGSAEGPDELPGATFSTGLTSAGDADQARILMARASRGWVVTPRNPLTIRLAGGVPTIDETGVLSAPFRPAPSMYGLTYGTPTPTGLDPDIRAAALQLPDEIDPRLVDLARRLSGESGSDEDRVAATVDWLGDCCTYSLDVGAFVTDQPVAEFLFDKQRGYCEYFASAAAVLLRLQGIPTRYVTGLSVHATNRRGDHYLVRALDAHAWIEVWIAGVGWVEVDPTPAGQYAALRTGMDGGWVRRSWESVSGYAAEVMARMGTDWRAGLAWLGQELLRAVAAFAAWWKVGLGVVLLIIAVVVGRRLQPRLRTRPVSRLEPSDPGVGPELAALMERLELRWSELGHPRPSYRAHLEHLEALSGDSLPTGLVESSRAAVMCYYEARFGGNTPVSEDIARLHVALER